MAKAANSSFAKATAAANKGDPLAMHGSGKDLLRMAAGGSRPSLLKVQSSKSVIDIISELQRWKGTTRYDGVDFGERFETVKELGAGAFGTVYRAKDQGSGIVVAIKQVGKEAAAATGAEKGAYEEFSKCVRISHPHVLRVFSYFDTPHSLYIVSEIAAGGELHEYLCSHPELNDEAGIARLVSQGLAAIVHLHHEGMTHHDVKPPNLLVTGHAWAGDASGATPLVVLADFGTAKLMQKAAHRVRRVSIVEGEGSKKEVKAVEVLGTPEYCGPECFSTLGAAHDAGRHSDVYALGVTIFELLVGEKPFQIEWGDVFDPDFDPTDTAKHWAQMMDVNLEADWSALKGVSEEGVALLRRRLDGALGRDPARAALARVLRRDARRAQRGARRQHPRRVRGAARRRGRGDRRPRRGAREWRAPAPARGRG